MKRATTMLGALALMAAGFLFAAPANATPPTPPGCTLVTSPSGYPTNSHYFYCGSNAAVYKQKVSSTFGTMPPHIKTQVENTGFYLYVFTKDSDYDAVFNEGITGLYRQYGVTNDGTYMNNQILHSAVFEKVVGHDPATKPNYGDVSQTQIEKTTIHELGHAIDVSFSFPSVNSTDFQTALAADWTYINGLTRAQVFPNGVPTKKYDGVGTWTAYTPGSTDSNETIIKALWPWLFQTSLESKSELYVTLFQQYRNGWVNFDYTNPYVDTTQVGTHTVTMIQFWSKFINVKDYFSDVWTQGQNP